MTRQHVGWVLIALGLLLLPIFLRLQWCQAHVCMYQPAAPCISEAQRNSVMWLPDFDDDGNFVGMYAQPYIETYCVEHGPQPKAYRVNF